MPIKSILPLAVLLFLHALLGCGSDTAGVSSSPQPGNATAERIAHDLSTPEGAVLALEDAYRARDLEAAVRCKDFTVEARLMLQKLQQDFSSDQEILSKTAEVLELGFRSELQNTGFSDFRNVTSTFVEKKPYQGREDIVELTETCRHPDGSTTTNDLVVAKTPGGWKVIAVPD